ncbi:MAG: hypothetical protein Q7T39_14370, partial [Polaromonas sp.]|nr:hypothetical protein [Polaromonas sp.]
MTLHTPSASGFVSAPRLAAAPLLALVAALLLSGCSSFDALQGDKVDYKSAGKAPSLEVPPDLTQLSRDTRYVVPGSSV